ncbi:hypothetical protein [uncultured Prevotella sp.]|uniref:hypothetical protein n=1 Tax=uncultured Prevotella sp. TaxID=159272 RepID=UPI002598B2E1|nr:hypothetical protein [uncultured Prevotella sp.]
MRGIGFDINPISSLRPIGNCVFDGIFYNNKCLAVVVFNSNTQIVNEIQTIISFDDQNKAKAFVDHIITEIDSKYPQSIYIKKNEYSMEYMKAIIDDKEDMGFISVSLDSSGTDVHVIHHDLEISER